MPATTLEILYWYPWQSGNGETPLVYDPVWDLSDKFMSFFPGEREPLGSRPKVISVATQSRKLTTNNMIHSWVSCFKIVIYCVERCD